MLTLQTFAAEDEAVELANSTPYGLSAIVYTSSQERAERVGRAIRAGIVWVNTFLVRDLTAPFGGIGISGIGREGGDYALDFHSDLKTLQIAEGTHVLTIRVFSAVRVSAQVMLSTVRHSDDRQTLGSSAAGGGGRWSARRRRWPPAASRGWPPAGRRRSGR